MKGCYKAADTPFYIQGGGWNNLFSIFQYAINYPRDVHKIMVQIDSECEITDI